MEAGRPSAQAVVKRPNTWDGFKSVFQAFAFLAKNPETWPAAMVPAILFTLLSAFGIFAGITWLRPEVVALLGLDNPESWYATLGSWAVQLLVSLATAVVGVWASLIVTPPLSSPALEHLVGLQEGQMGIPKRGELGFFNEVLCGLKAQMFAALFATPILALLWLVDLLFPPAAVVTVPLKILVLSFAVAWNLFDYPLTLRGVGPSERLSLLGSNKGAVLGFGLGIAALFWVPCFGVLMLPVGAVGATRLMWRLLAAEPTTLPQLPRPQVADFNALPAPNPVLDAEFAELQDSASPVGAGRDQT